MKECGYRCWKMGLRSMNKLFCNIECEDCELGSRWWSTFNVPRLDGVLSDIHYVFSFATTFLMGELIR